MKLSPGLELFTTRHVAVVEGDRAAAEMLHMFFRLMELECSMISPTPDPVPTLGRLRPDVLILDLDLPDLRALDIAREIRAILPRLPIIYLTDQAPPQALDGRVMRNPRGKFEELLALLEVVLAVEE